MNEKPEQAETDPLRLDVDEEFDEARETVAGVIEPIVQKEDQETGLVRGVWVRDPPLEGEEE